MRAYFATKLSPNISRMPNGFLICKNVPIARTGTQDYQGKEIGNSERPDDMFHVYRDESEVFNPVALASFEGVPLVDEHPSGDVTADNSGNLLRGIVKDVRRGTDSDSDKVIADIIVTDPVIISEIENGKREISCGYKCDFEPDESGRVFQRNIRGNHVALVSKGRAGQDVAIKDVNPEISVKSETQIIPPERRTKFMKKQTASGDSKSMLSKFLATTAADSDPDVVAEIAEQLVNAVEGDSPVDEFPEKKEEASIVAPVEKGKDEEEIPVWAAKLIEKVDRLDAALSVKPHDEDPLGELEKDLELNGEESVTKPVEEMKESSDEEPALDTDEEITDEEESSGGDTSEGVADSNVRDAISQAKKQVAKIKDASVRRAVSDSMAKLIRQSYGIKPSTPKDSYGVIATAKQDNAKAMKDAYPTFDNMEARQATYDKRNPHKKG
ncbi:hypothetical protein FACS1894187_07060 [Synergistales bacterium]|nr:hypothetical protein FACS1894187_07060 [Synergistales bacterium]